MPLEPRCSPLTEERCDWQCYLANNPALHVEVLKDGSSPADKSNLTAAQAALLSAHWAQQGSKKRTCECIDAPAPACPLKPTAEELDACYPVLLRNGHFYRVFPERHMLPGVVQLVASTSYCGITGLHFLSSFFCWRVGGWVGG